MFNPMTPAEMVTALGRAAHAAGRSEEPASDFSRGQLMSAYSACRHLSVELAEFPRELRCFANAIAERFADAPDTVAKDRFAQLAVELHTATEAAEIGNLVSAGLDDLRGDDSPAAARLRAETWAAIRALSDREVALLADVIEVR
jgi:hypothetical protein